MSRRPRDLLSQTLTEPLTFDGSKSPVKTALFLILCAAWIVPGLTGHDPWKPDEAAAFAPIHAMLNGGAWSIPTLAGQPYFDHAPLYYWVAYLTAQLCGGFLPAHDAARLASGLFNAGTLLALAGAAIELNGERAGRIAVVMLLGAPGLLIRGHEINPDLAGVFGTTVTLYAALVSRRRPVRGALCGALGVAAAGLGGGWLLAVAAVLVLAGAPLISLHWRSRAVALALAGALLAGVGLIALWPLALLDAGISPALWQGGASGSPWLASAGMRAVDPAYFPRTLLWAALPAWPIALMTLIRERRRIVGHMEVKYPLLASCVLLAVHAFLLEPTDITVAALLPPIVLLALPVLDRLSRTFVSLLDWFGIAAFGWLVMLIWAAWLGYVTGVPTGAARWVGRQAPGYVHAISWPMVAAAAGLTVLWLLAVLRTRQSNRRALVNWAAGLTLVWVVASCLWLPAMDYVRTYRGVALEIRGRVGANAHCIAESNLGLAQRASFDYFAGLRFAPAHAAGRGCGLLLIQGEAGRDPQPGEAWQLIWQGARPGEGQVLFGSRQAGKAEAFRLYLRRQAERPGA
jgi:4-amino-4-deoxy-L-arabinose transferase-like glycosyltransferase